MSEAAMLMLALLGCAADDAAKEPSPPTDSVTRSDTDTGAPGAGTGSDTDTRATDSVPTDSDSAPSDTDSTTHDTDTGAPCVPAAESLPFSFPMHDLDDAAAAFDQFYPPLLDLVTELQNLEDSALAFDCPRIASAGATLYGGDCTNPLGTTYAGLAIQGTEGDVTTWTFLDFSIEDSLGGHDWELDGAYVQALWHGGYAHTFQLALAWTESGGAWRYDLDWRFDGDGVGNIRGLTVVDAGGRTGSLRVQGDFDEATEHYVLRGTGTAIYSEIAPGACGSTYEVNLAGCVVGTVCYGSGRGG